LSASINLTAYVKLLWHCVILSSKIKNGWPRNFYFLVASFLCIYLLISIDFLQLCAQVITTKGCTIPTWHLKSTYCMNIWVKVFLKKHETKNCIDNIAAGNDFHCLFFFLSVFLLFLSFFLDFLLECFPSFSFFYFLYFIFLCLFPSLVNYHFYMLSLFLSHNFSSFFA
jgi:hypothetical protein